jgi:Tol biopolymer transport system component
MTIRAANDDIWVYDLVRGTFTRLTFGGGNSGLPEWTPDGKRVLFFSERGKESTLFWKPSDGSGTIERISKEAGGITFSVSFSPDGRKAIYGTNGDLHEISIADQSTKPLLAVGSNDDAPRLSPDGQLLAYLSDESGRPEVFVVPYPSLAGKWQISTGGADSPPIWSPSGNELFFAEEGILMKVDVTRGSNVTFSKAQKVCLMPSRIFSIYDIARDGKRFLVTVAADPDAEAVKLNVIVGWFTELKKKFAGLGG